MEAILWVLPYIPVFLIVISLVITIHELGHYWIGRWFGTAAESFAIGFGKPIVEFRDKRGTRWRINWLPLGGFVGFIGETKSQQDAMQKASAVGDAEEREKLKAAAASAPRPAGAIEGGETTFFDGRIYVGRPLHALGPWQRIAVYLGGPILNFIFAILVFSMIGYANGLPQAKEVYVTSVIKGGAAEAAGFKNGDIILQAGGRAVQTGYDVTSVTQLNSGEPVTYLVRRGLDELTLVATPKLVEVSDKALRMKQKVGQVGIGIAQRDTSIRGLSAVEAVGYGFTRTTDTVGQTINVIRRLLTGRESLDKLSGPVGILHLTSGVTEMTMKQEGVELSEKIRQLLFMLFQLAAALSVAIGFFNLVPLPFLDGGRVVMTLPEAATGRPLSAKVENAALTFGLVCLVGFALVVTLQDFFRLSGGS